MPTSITFKSRALTRLFLLGGGVVDSLTPVREAPGSGVRGQVKPCLVRVKRIRLRKVQVVRNELSRVEPRLLKPVSDEAGELHVSFGRRQMGLLREVPGEPTDTIQHQGRLTVTRSAFRKDRGPRFGFHVKSQVLPGHAPS